MASLLRASLAKPTHRAEAEQRHAPLPMCRFACDIIAQRDPARHERHRWSK
jgi:hypothetical protein